MLTIDNTGKQEYFIAIAKQDSDQYHFTSVHAADSDEAIDRALALALFHGGELAGFGKTKDELAEDLYCQHHDC